MPFIHPACDRSRGCSPTSSAFPLSLALPARMPALGCTLRPSSVFMLVCFTAGVPILLAWIVWKHSQLLHVGIDMQSQTWKVESVLGRLRLGRGMQQSDVTWDFRMRLSDNRAKSIYSMFKFQWRYFKVAIMIQKLVLTVSIFIFNENVVGAAWFICAIHGVSFALYLPWIGPLQPYNDDKSNWLACAVALASAFNPLMIIFVANDSIADGAPEYVLAAALVLVNVVLPVLALAGGYSRGVKAKRALKEAGEHIDKVVLKTDDLRRRADAKDTDEKLDEATLGALRVMFRTMAVGGFLSMALLAYFQLENAVASNVVPPTPADLGDQYTGVLAQCRVEALVVSTELVGYGNWRNFTRHCCCRDRQSENSYGVDFMRDAVELWSCDNGYLKERNRTGGLFIRDFCSPVFNAQYSFPEYNADAAQLVVYRNGEDPSAPDAAAHDGSETALAPVLAATPAGRRGPSGDYYVTGW